MRLICALALMLAWAAPAAAAAPGVRVTVSRGEYGEWLIDYEFRHRAPIWFFPRTNADAEGRPWRQLSWAVDTPGVRLERAGHYDALSGDGAPLTRVRIRFRPFGDSLTADYTPALRFSDGALAFYTDHFVVVPGESREAIRELPADLNGVELAQPPVTLAFQDPGRRLILRGRTSRGRVRFRARDNGTYVYAGNAPVTETPAFSGVIDSGLPAWTRAELESFTPRLMRLYADRLGAPAGGRPMALIAWGGADRPGWSLGGSVLENMVVMQISGQQVVESSPLALAPMRWFIGHEAAHFWMGQTVRYARHAEGWIMEGAADLMAIRALQQLAPGYDARAELQRELDDCVRLTGPGESLAGAPERDEHRAHYACGAMLLLAAEGTGGSDVFAFLRGLIDANRADREVTADDWLARFAAVARDPALVAEVRGFVERGAADPRAFWLRLFAATGVGVETAGEGLRLL